MRTLYTEAQDLGNLKFDFCHKRNVQGTCNGLCAVFALLLKPWPKLTKHFLGCYLENELVQNGVLTLGWGTQPKATIAKLFNDKNFCRIKFDATIC